VVAVYGERGGGAGGPARLPLGDQLATLRTNSVV
jgi:hypothetical protein